MPSIGLPGPASNALTFPVAGVHSARRVDPSFPSPHRANRSRGLVVPRTVQPRDR